LKNIPGVEVIAVANRTKQSGESIAKEFNIPKVYSRWQDLINDRKVDAVVIGTWPYMHKSITIAGLEAGKHVLCEARMAMNAKEAHEMFETAKKKSDLVTHLVPSSYTLKFDQTIRNLLQSNFVGNLIAVDFRSVDGSFVDTTSDLHWRQDIDKSGLNIMRLGIWYETLLRWVGPASNVMAMTKVVVKQRRNPDTGKMTPIQIPDHVDVIAELAAGAQARFQFSSVIGLPNTKTEAWLFGTEGTIRLDLDNQLLMAGKRGQSSLSVVQMTQEDQKGWRVEEEFINAIRGKEEISLTTFEDGVKYMEFTEAVWKSATEKKAIALPLV